MSALLRPFGSIYGWAAAARASAYQREWFHAQHLSRPVISVGNLTMGGTGKTPLVELIARLLLSRGIRPSILSRGYRRNRGARLIALEPARTRIADPRLVGDEPALLASAVPGAAIVICANRFAGGRVAEERFHVDAHILDDGFQHLALARDANLVTLDATQPFSDFSISPAGRQRERCAAIRRASAVMITRTGEASSAQLEQQIRQIHPAVPVFHCRTRLLGWFDLAHGCHLPAEALAGCRVYAFCGIGNPNSFFRQLKGWGCELAGSIPFRDHYRYTNSDVARLVLSARNAGATLVTTMKDVMNLPTDSEGELDALACEIEAEVIEAREFEQYILSVPGLRPSSSPTC